MFIILFSENDGVTFRYGEALHGGEQMAAGGVRDLPLVGMMVLPLDLERRCMTENFLLLVESSDQDLVYNTLW